MRALAPLDLPLEGVTLIEASAGTGKTFTITTLYLRLLLERELRVGDILVVTYTNAATAELRTRLRRRLLDWGRPGDDGDLAEYAGRRQAAGQVERDQRRVTGALHGFDDAAVFTIHGFCQRMLQEHAFESGVPFDAQLITDQRSLVREIVRDFWVRELHSAPADVVASLVTQYNLLDELTALALKVAGLRDVPVLPALSALRREAGEGQAGGALPRSPAGKKVTQAALRAAATAVKQARQLALQVPLVAHVRDELSRRKDEAGVQYFDDLLTRLRDALAGPGGELLAASIRRRYRAVLIDEFQDTDPVQWEIFDRLYGQRARATCGASAADTPPLFLIGDPKQAIYSFRGADVFTYVEAKQSAGDERVRTLTTNYRSDPRLVEAVNTLFGRAGLRQPFARSGIGFAPATARPGADTGLGGSYAGRAPLEILYLRKGDKPQIDKGVGRERLYHDIAAEIARFLDSETTVDGEPVRANHVAVLCRKNDEARRVQHQLRRLRIPSVLQTDASVLETIEADELGRILRAMAEPGDSAALLAALATPMLGARAPEIQGLREGDAKWDLWTGRFHRWHEIWLASGFLPAFRALRQDCEVEKRVLEGVDGERRMTNLLHLGELVQTAAVETRRGPQALAEWFGEMCRNGEARADAIADAAQIRLESDDRALRLVTVHKSKGLEYPVVFCPFLWDGKLLIGRDEKEVRYHDPDHGNQLRLDIGSDEKEKHLDWARQEALAENLRLLYVALTRARHRCVVAWGLFKDAETSALGYLLHQAPAPGGDVAADTASRIEGMSDDAMIADLEKLVAQSGGTLEIAALSSDDGPSYRLRDAEAADPQLRFAARRLRVGWRTASFSSLTAGAEPVSVAAEEGIDRDEADRGEEPVPEPRTAAQRPAPVVLADFPAGTRAGQLVHAIFEYADFTAGEAGLRPVVAEQVPRFGFDPVWCEPLVLGVADVLRTPLRGRGVPFRLADVSSTHRLNELEFLFSLSAPGGSGDGLDSGALAAVFRQHGAVLHGEYLERLRHLGFAPLSGYLKGFVDLAFAHDGVWYVVDWKSNHLGAEPRRYQPPRLAAVMAQHHYYLQYHLYVVALHRYLRLRLPGYDYERDFGGVFYLFVRGMAPAYEAGNGVFHDRPPRALIEALSELM